MNKDQPEIKSLDPEHEVLSQKSDEELFENLTAEPDPDVRARDRAATKGLSMHILETRGYVLESHTHRLDFKNGDGEVVCSMPYQLPHYR